MVFKTKLWDFGFTNLAGYGQIPLEDLTYLSETKSPLASTAQRSRASACVPPPAQEPWAKFSNKSY
jgi:hypothetical protein